MAASIKYLYAYVAGSYVAIANNDIKMYYRLPVIQGVFLRPATSADSKFAISLSINLAQHSIYLETLAQDRYIVDTCQTFVYSA